MKWQLIFLLLMGMKWWRFVYSTCVFESDFGFTFNCAFKKSSIFRIRNLGGVKGYFGLGFSVGDELGFRESLSNVESTNRRSVESGRSASGYFQQLLTTTQRTERQVSSENSPPPANGSRLGNERSNHAINIRAPGSKYASVSLNPVTVPPFKPIYPASGNQLSRPVRLSKDDENRHSLPPTLIAVPAFASLPDSIAKLSSSSASSASPAYNKRVTQQAFQNMLQNANRRFALTSGNGAVSNDIELSNSINQQPKIPSTNRYHVTPDPFFPDTVSHALKNVAQMNNISADALLASIQLRQQQLLLQQQKQHLAALTTTTVFEPPSTSTTTSTTTTTTTTTTTPPPTTSATTAIGSDQISKLNSLATSIKQKYSVTSTHKVMNAPKEYYPVSYEKNFDDNFTAKVELPDTSFSCGDQKHFPGLYADEDLNCMVFHVCAFTDEGLVMKSFLCPESTLFDQTILKCNWWFYVDCKSSKKLYDSNIPISKSYQLMKALAFFSSYSKKEQNVVT